MENKPSVLTKKYEVGRCIGQGTFGKVYFGRSIATNQSVAIKMIEKERIIKSGLVDQIKREISVMRIVKHPNIIDLHEVIATKTKIFFILEYAKGGELFNKVSKGKLRDDAARKFFRQLIEAVEFCHNRGIFHRDIKPENILLDELDTLKVSDFGLSALAESARKDGLLHTTCGTPAYVAPEVINRRGYDGAKADVWSCGVVLYVLLAGFLPFHDSNLIEMYRKIGRGDFKSPGWFPADARRLIQKILDPNPITRISIAKIKEHSWYRKETAAKSILLYSRTGSDASTSRQCEDVDSTPKVMNAFDIISRSSGFDLSNLFHDSHVRDEARFTSLRPASVIIEKLEEVAARVGLRLVKKEAGLLKLEGKRVSGKCRMGIDAEIYEMSPNFHFVEFRRLAGDSLEYRRILEEVKPALHDIVWVWQGHDDSRTETEEVPVDAKQLEVL